jgi:hypothetical protein
MSTDLWRELHSRALNYDPKNGSDLIWLQKWSSKIPRFTTGCSCNEHWIKWYRSNPPNFTSVDKYFEWTVKAHNDVNVRIGKPTISIEDAKLIYGGK